MAHQLDLNRLNQRLESKKPEEIMAWAVEEFTPRLALTSSFGPESGVLLHMVSRIDPNVPVLFLETGYHFPETLAYKETLTGFLGLANVVELRADPEKRAAVVAEHDGIPYEKNPDLCCHVNKVEPLHRALSRYDAWVSGIRRTQTDFRKRTRMVDAFQGGRYKISPLANFTSRDAWRYLKEHHIPMHPLFNKGYRSIGCWPCTCPIRAGEDERAGRWAGKDKKECGIHTATYAKVIFKSMG